MSIDIAVVSNLFENSLQNNRIWRAKIVLFSSIMITAGVMEYWSVGIMGFGCRGPLSAEVLKTPTTDHRSPSYVLTF